MDRVTGPVARRAGLLIRELEGELVVYDRDRHRGHCLNRTASELWRRCDGKTDVAALARSLAAACGVPASEEMVQLGLRQLARAHLLEDRRRHLGPADAITRRRLVRRLGSAGMWAALLPLVTTIVSPKSASAQSCLPKNASCTSSAQCCTGCCRSSNMKCKETGPCLGF